MKSNTKNEVKIRLLFFLIVAHQKEKRKQSFIINFKRDNRAELNTKATMLSTLELAWSGYETH